MRELRGQAETVKAESEDMNKNRIDQLRKKYHEEETEKTTESQNT